MNMQAMVKQAQKLQQEMLNEKQKISEMIFEVENEATILKMKGNKTVQELIIKKSDDMEMVADMIMIAFNQAIKQIEAETEKRLGQYTRGMPGLF